MKQVIIIEPEQANLTQIATALNEIESHDLVYFPYKNLIGFYEDLKKQIKNNNQDLKREKGDAEKSPSLDIEKIKLIIIDSATFDNISLLLWKKLKSYLTKISKEGNDVKILITSYDEGEYNALVNKYINPIVFNLLLKPFDHLLLKQTLSYAIAEKEPQRPEEFYTQETNTFIELIKDIEIDRITELGFRTRSRRKIEIGKIARYFGTPFDGENGDSVFAYCYSNQPIEEGSNKYLSSFSYLGIPKDQLLTIRRKIESKPNKTKLEFPGIKNSEKKQPDRIVILSRDKLVSENLKSILIEKFSNIEVSLVGSPFELSSMLSFKDKKELGMHDKVPRAFNTEKEVNMVFNEHANKLLSIVEAENQGTASKLINEFFGKDINTINLEPEGIFKLFKSESLNKLQKILDAKRLENNILLKVFLDDEIYSYIKVLNIEESFNFELACNVYNLKVRELSSAEWQELNQTNYKPIKEIKLVFIDMQIPIYDSVGVIKSIVEKLNGKSDCHVKYYALGKQPLTQYSQISDAEKLNDLFLLPIDIFYLVRKIKMHHPEISLNNKEENNRKSISLNEKISTALPVTITSISEVALTLLYHRPLAVGDFRSFVLWMPNLKNMPEIYGVCTGSQEFEKGKFICSFMFFGVRDAQLKFIRKWIIENHISQKNKN